MREYEAYLKIYRIL